MTALEEWETYSALGGYLPAEEAIIEKADSAIESMRVCGSCAKVVATTEPHIGVCCNAVTDKEIARRADDGLFGWPQPELGDHCHFAPSRWQEREG